MRRLLALALGFAALATVATAARAGDADWPCAQRLVPQLTAAAYWPSPVPPPDKDWRADPSLESLVANVTSRDVALEDGEARLAAYADSLPASARPQRLAETFGALVDATNAERETIISRLEALARRQREIGDIVARVTEELQKIPQDTTGPDADRRAEIVQRRNFLIRSVEETQRTMRYACEVPGQLESRLGRYARLLQGKL